MAILIGDLYIQVYIEEGIMYGKKWNESWDGFYSNQEYYCVQTKDRTPERIATIDVHEKCHALIDKNRGHFCE